MARIKIILLLEQLMESLKLKASMLIKFRKLETIHPQARRAVEGAVPAGPGKILGLSRHSFHRVS